MAAETNIYIYIYIYIYIHIYIYIYIYTYIYGFSTVPLSRFIIIESESNVGYVSPSWCAEDYRATEAILRCVERPHHKSRSRSSVSETSMASDVSVSGRGIGSVIIWLDVS